MRRGVSRNLWMQYSQAQGRLAPMCVIAQRKAIPGLRVEVIPPAQANRAAGLLDPCAA